MRRKYKLTGCARFLIFLLIFTPIVLIGVSLYYGENPIEKAKELLNIETRVDNPESEEMTYEGTGKEDAGEVSEINILREQTRIQKSTIETLKKENEDLRNQILEKDREIQLLKQQSGNN